MAHLHSALVVVDVTTDLTATRQAAQALARVAERLHVLALVPERRDALRLEAWPLVLEVAGPCTYEVSFETARIATVAGERGAELVVLGPWAPPRSARARALTLLELTRPGGAHVLLVGGACASVPANPRVVGLVVERDQSLGPAVRELQALLDAPSLVALAHEPSEERADALELELQSLLPRAQLTVAPFRASALGFAAELRAAAVRHQVDLLVASMEAYSDVAALVTALLSADELDRAAAPLLVLKRRGQTPSAERLAASDALWAPAAGTALSVEALSRSGRLPLDPHARFHVVGHERGEGLPHRDGVVLLPPDFFPGEPPAAIGLAPAGGALEVAPARVLPASRPVVLADADLPAEHLGALEPLVAQATVVFVRLRDAEGLEAARARLSAAVPWGGPVALIDASAFLDDGGALDVPPRVDGLRLVRLGVRLQLLGVPVAAVMLRGEAPLPTSSRLEVLTPSSLTARPRWPRAIGAEPRLDALTASRPVPGHRVRLELDNRRARLDTLAAIDGATSTVHWQCYIVQDDAAAEAFVDAFRRASERGVRVRVMVDALYSLHGAFGFTNPLLQRLAALPGVEVRGWQPLSGLPSVNDLRQRNHRKLAVIDGRRGGRTRRTELTSV